MISDPKERRSVVVVAVGAVLLRLALLLGRGHYVAFDEGWYLLLGRNLWSGDGYTLSGLQHVALSPLFPIVAGGLARIVGDPVWAGRIVAAGSSGLLVLPAWYIFRRLGGRTTALVGALFVALLPSLAPFVVPYWIGWDLWVGAEPLLHLFVFTGIAFFLGAWSEESKRVGLMAAAGCGVAFGLAYLARPEAIVLFGLLGLGSVIGSVRALPTKAGRIVLCGVVFAAVAAPYWIYLHGSLGRWTITGLGVDTTPRMVITTRSAGTDPGPNRIETMLWEGDASAYLQRLYALDASGTSLVADYWGVRPAGQENGISAADEGGAPVSARPDSTTAPEADPGTVAETDPADVATGTNSSPPPGRESISQARSESQFPSQLLRYAEALGVVVPWYLWLLAVPGLLAPGLNRRLDLEALVGLPLVATSVLIARVVAIDPRTQLFIAPLAAFYAARGVLVVVDRIGERMGEHVRAEVVTRILVGAVAAIMLGTSAVRLAMSLTVGSPHHVVAAENAAVGQAIRETTAEDATVMSFHPALALFADRDWRVLPLEPMDRIVRYARTQPNPHLVLSVFYPPELRPAEEPHYLVVPVPSDLPESDRWRIDIPELRTVYAFGELVPME